MLFNYNMEYFIIMARGVGKKGGGQFYTLENFLCIECWGKDQNN